MTRLGTVWPGSKLRFDVTGTAVPSACTVRCPPRVGAVTVTLSTTADTPEAGTPPRPATGRWTVPCGPTLATGAPIPDRVSRSLAGVSDWNAPGSVGAPAR